MHFGWNLNQPKRCWSVLMVSVLPPLPMDFSIRLLSVWSDSVDATPLDLRSSEGHGLFIWNFSTLSVDDIVTFEVVFKFFSAEFYQSLVLSSVYILSLSTKQCHRIGWIIPFFWLFALCHTIKCRNKIHRIPYLARPPNNLCTKFETDSTGGSSTIETNRVEKRTPHFLSAPQSKTEWEIRCTRIGIGCDWCTENNIEFLVCCVC